MNAALPNPLESIQALYPCLGHPRSVAAKESFAISALAPAMAVIFTNPFDTAKVRIQLQQLSSSPAQKIVYKNSLHTIATIYANEGLSGLQKGLTPAILREGMYDPIMFLIHDNSLGSAPAWKRLAAGSMCGVMGAFSCNPFELVKTRLQSDAAASTSSIASSAAVGHQHGYRGTWHALKSVIRADGFAGLYRGSLLSVGRSIVGSGSNLTTFTMSKEYLMLKRGWPDSKSLDTICGLSSAVVSVFFMNPIDVVRTRYYNQTYINNKGQLYSSGTQAVKTIFLTEGFRAFYKGLVTHFFRIGPHFCLTFLFLGILRRSTNDYYGYLDRRESFASFDRDADCRLSPVEIRLAVKKMFVGLNDVQADDIRDKILKRADRDGDGAISFQEYPFMIDEIRDLVSSSASSKPIIH